jgi:hypothetical protein
MASAGGQTTENRSRIAAVDSSGGPPGEGLRESAFFVVANEREITGVNHRVQILLGAWQLRRLAQNAAELVSAVVVAVVPFPGRQVHVRLRAYRTRMRCEVSGMYPSESALGHAPQVFTVPAPSEAVTLLEDRSVAWGREDFSWGRTFWFELDLAAPDGEDHPGSGETR